MGVTATIPLSQGSATRAGRYVAIVDDVDFDLARRFTWTADVRKDGQVYACRYVYLGNGRRRKVYLHRVIARRAFGRRAIRPQIDHRDNSGLNNRRDNLRVATAAQNQWNSSRGRRGLKGVEWSASSRKWRARIKVNGVRHDLGVHATQERAAQAYDAAAVALRGAYARPNFGAQS